MLVEGLLEVQKTAQVVRTILETVRQAGSFSPNLTGMCAIGSATLFSELNSLKLPVQPVICANHGHCWVELGKYLIDVTATQFNDLHGKIYPKVLLSKRSTFLKEHAAHDKGVWQRDFKFDTVEDLVTWQLEYKWPNSQIADKEVADKILNECKTVYVYNDDDDQLIGDFSDGCGDPLGLNEEDDES